MARAGKGGWLLFLGALAGVVLLRGPAFVPPPLRISGSPAYPGELCRHHFSAAASVAAVLGGAGVAHADKIGDAAVVLAKSSYPFMKEVPWNDPLFLTTPGKADPIAWTKAIGKMIDMGAAMDPNLVKAGGNAHHQAMIDLPRNGVCTEAQLAEIYASIGRMIASVPKEKTMGVYNAVKDLVDPAVPTYLMSKVNGADAQQAYGSLLEFTKVVESNPITPVVSPSVLPSKSGDAIAAASKKLSAAAYPFMQQVDWTSDLYQKPVPGKSPQEVMKAIDKMIVMGTKMDGAELQAAAKAHVNAIQGMSGKGVLAQSDFEAINTGLGKIIATLAPSDVFGVYNAMGGLVGGGEGAVPKKLLSSVQATDAMKAYGALMEFKDVVAASNIYNSGLR